MKIIKEEKEFKKTELYLNKIEYIEKTACKILKTNLNYINEDLLQEIKLKCWEKFDNFDEKKGSLNTFLYNIILSWITQYNNNNKKDRSNNTIFESYDNFSSSSEDIFYTDDIENNSIMNNINLKFQKIKIKELLWKRKSEILFLYSDWHSIKYICNVLNNKNNKNKKKYKTSTIRYIIRKSKIKLKNHYKEFV